MATKQINPSKRIRIFDGMPYATGGFLSSDGSRSSFAGAANGASGIIDGLDQGSPYGRKRVGTSIASGALSGAATGAAFGPWGALIGGVVGGVAGWIGGAAAKKKEQKAINGMDMQRQSAQRSAAGAALAADPGLQGGYGNRGYYARGGSLRNNLADQDQALGDYVRDTNPWLLEGQLQSDALDGRLKLAHDGKAKKKTVGLPPEMASQYGYAEGGPLPGPGPAPKPANAYEEARVQKIDSLGKAWGVPTRDIATKAYWNYGDNPSRTGIPRRVDYTYKAGQPGGRQMIDYYDKVTRGTNAGEFAEGGPLRGPLKDKYVSLRDPLNVAYAYDHGTIQTADDIQRGRVDSTFNRNFNVEPGGKKNASNVYKQGAINEARRFINNETSVPTLNRLFGAKQFAKGGPLKGPLKDKYVPLEGNLDPAYAYDQGRLQARDWINRGTLNAGDLSFDRTTIAENTSADNRVRTGRINEAAAYINNQTNVPALNRLFGVNQFAGRTSYAEGGDIDIKPENKGKFTAWASRHDMSVQEAARHVMANKEDYSGGVVAMANFAKNFGGKKALGGSILDTMGKRKGGR